MKDINVAEIIAKHSGYSVAQILDTERVMIGQDEVFNIIREIVEVIVDKCAQEAELLSNGEKCDKVYSIEKHDHFYHSVDITVDKQSILNVKKMINYDYKVVEIGCINHRGFYDADMSKLVQSLKNTFNNDSLSDS